MGLESIADVALYLGGGSGDGLKTSVEIMKVVMERAMGVLKLHGDVGGEGVVDILKAFELGIPEVLGQALQIGNCADEVILPLVEVGVDLLRESGDLLFPSRCTWGLGLCCFLLWGFRGGRP